MRPTTRLCLEVLEDRCVPAYNVLSVTGTALNNLGQIVGNGTLYNSGVPTDLNLGGTATERALNDLGQVVGALRTDIDRAFMWDPNLGMMDLGITGYSVANGINDSSQVVGTIGYEYTGSTSRAFLWDAAGGMCDLGTFGGTSTVARDINNSGQVVGWRETRTSSGSTNYFNHLGYIYDSTTANVTFLGTLGTQSSRALDINNAGQIVGISGSFGGPSGSMWFSQKTFLWQNGVMTDLGMTPSQAGILAINDAGQVVSGKYLWENGVVSDVNSLVSLPAGWTVASISDINNAGMMIGWANETVGTSVYAHPILLVPDTIPTFGISDARVTETDAEPTTAVFTVTRTGPLDQTLTVDYTTMDDIYSQAFAGMDYLAASGSLTFNPGEAIQTITVTILGDTVDEVNESFYVRLSAPAGSYVADLQGRGLIVDNDETPPPPSLSINDVSIVEGKSGIRYAVFTVILSAPSTSAISVFFATASGTATAGNDYGATSGSLTFNSGETTKTIQVVIYGDKKKEKDETFFVNLTAASGLVNLLDPDGMCTIKNDD